LGFLTHEDLVRINSAGAPLDAKRHASSETLMHLAVYAGTDAQAVVHAHPPMVVAFSLVHDSFAPVSFEEKYTIGEVSIIAQDTPTATEPAKIVEELRYHSVAIIKAHGTVAIGKDFQEAFLLTDLLEEAVRCQFAYQSAALSRGRDAPAAARAPKQPTAGVTRCFRRSIWLSSWSAQTTTRSFAPTAVPPSSPPRSRFVWRKPAPRGRSGSLPARLPDASPAAVVIS
jgi:L-fuculose-phosphate aldolase